MATDSSGVESSARVILDDHAITKSPTDQRSYRIIELDNALRCVLVHEPEARQSSAALAVAAGHFHDPNNAHGLAHFLEHMLFLGTEKYPDANSYQAFISGHGGNHNAWTGTEFSNYYFTVDAAYFDQALDRFMRFFYQPLFDAKWVKKELQSIESEFQLKRQDELRRLYQVHKATSNPKHPFSKFSVGNLSTLKDSAQATLQQQLQQFFQRWYCARRMTLVLVGPQSLEQLAEIAQRHAQSIQSGCADMLYLNDPLYLPEQLGVELHVKPLKDARRLIITFALPGIDDDYANKTTSYIAHLLGYEGPGSLYGYLRDQHWINSLAAGGGISGSNFKDFNINMQLTDQGMANRDAIIAAIFSYIQTIRESGVTPWRYDERRVSVMNAFHFQEQPRASDLAPQLAINLHHYLAEDIIFGDYRMDGLFEPKLRQFLDCMQPDNMRVTVIHKALETDQVEPIYGTHYAIQPISAERQTAYLKHDPIPASLPEANIYLKVPWQLQTIAPNEATEYPEKSLITPGLESWHLHDLDFRQPKAHLYLGLQLPRVIATPASFAQARLWCELMLDKLNEQCYDAEIAGLHFNLYPQQQGITLHVSGPAYYVPQLAETLIHSMAAPQFCQQRWMDLRQRLLTNWRQALLHKPLNFLFSYLNVQLQPHTFSVLQLAEELEQMDFAVFNKTSGALFQQATAKMFAHGDLHDSQLEPVHSALTDWLGLTEQRPVADLTPAPLSKLQQPLKVQTQHPDHAVIAVVQSLDTSTSNQGIFMLMNYVLQPRFFAQLRTEQQLGYLVGTTYLPMQEHPHLLFYVQSSRVDGDTIESAIREFFGAINRTMAEISEEEFHKAQQSLTQQLTEKDSSLRSRSQRLWSAITQQDFDFSRLNRISADIEQMTFEHFSISVKQLFNNNSSQMFLSASPMNFDRSR
ncbi:insulinase family protein [Pseudidiomarina gelatinasegens]|uniref:insulinase family protein n=1 Tax=Pseudidiomarina gelatinasegens TaxID=2487740 RepID=UPI0030EC760E